MTILDTDGSKQISAINDTLKLEKNVKFRIRTNKDINGNFSSTVFLNSDSYDLDTFVNKFTLNGWSMRPMFSAIPTGANNTYTNQDITDFVSFVGWFLDRYKIAANIKYIELFNEPSTELLLGTLTLSQLLTTQNNIYDSVKIKYPDIMVGTHGFEYFFDVPPNSQGYPQMQVMMQMVEYFLDTTNHAKFDYWAFHEYSTRYSPITAPIFNRYAGIPGILSIRQKLDSVGWQSKPMFDTEHTPPSNNLPAISDTIDKIDAAYMIQELTIKKTLTYNGTPVLSGISPLKVIPRGPVGEREWGSLKPDGSASRSMKATALLLSKLNMYNYSSHVSGTLNSFNTIWVEKFISGSNNKELYIFFNPLSEPLTPSIFDAQTLNYTITLSTMPISVTLTDINENVTNLTPSQIIPLQAKHSPKFLEIEYNTNSVNNTDLESNVQIYPNPATDFIFLATDVQNKTARFSVINIFGETIASGIFKKGEQIKIDVHNLPSGIYFVTIQTEQSVQIQKIIVEQ